MKMEQTQLSETLTYKIQTPENNPEESVQHHCFLFSSHFWLFIGRYILPQYRSQWPRGLRRRSAAPCVLRLWVRIPPAYNRCTCVKRECTGQVKLNGRWQGIVEIKKRDVLERVRLCALRGGQKGPAIVAVCQCQNKWVQFVFEIVEISKL